MIKELGLKPDKHGGDIGDKFITNIFKWKKSVTNL
jgi:hypothetical protein